MNFTNILGKLIHPLILKSLHNLPINIRLPNDKLISNDSSKEITVHEWSTFWDILWAYDIGFSHAYLKGKWDTDDLPGIFELLSQTNNNEYSIVSGFALGKIPSIISQRIRSSNSIKKAPKNIQDHYDLSNDFFKGFLDKSMTYSSAIFSEETKTLHEGQLKKIDSLLSKAKIQKESWILDIGCGWGGLISRASQQFNCQSTGITLSKNQFQFSKELISELSLESKISIELQDYRLIDNKFDHIFSVEMLEAVGHKGINEFFHKCSQILNDKGTLQIQVITIPDERYEIYRKNCDFIQKFIFPGGLLPSLQYIKESANNFGFKITEQTSLRIDYVKTLKYWSDNLSENWNALAELGFSELDFRKFQYYFAYCQGAFSSGHIDNIQLSFSRE
tara:strand:+ start:1548 stop:2720 length:1173 start_codon:yes stop_codon:yes gene_type:complete